MIFTVGEFVLVKTKANVDVVLFVAVVLLIGFWLGLPADICDVSGIIITLLIVGRGNMIDFAELKRQWKTVCVSIIALTAACFALVFASQFIIGRDMVLAGTLIFGGGTAACVAMKNNKEEFALYSGAVLEPATTEKKKLIHFPESFDRPSFHLMKLGAVGVVSYYFSAVLMDMTGINVSYIIVALIMGTIFTELGFLYIDTLGKTYATGFIIFACVIILFSDFATCTPQDVLALPSRLCSFFV